MITAERKPFEEIKESLKNYNKIMVLACETCVAVCQAGGEKEAKILAQIYANRVRDWSSENVGLRSYASPISVRNVSNDISDAAVDTLLDVCRKNADDHIAFGYGIHFCPGAFLGRKEMQVAYARLLDRLTNIRLAEGKNDLSHWPNMVLRGLKELHITFEPRAQSAALAAEG